MTRFAYEFASMMRWQQTHFPGAPSDPHLQPWYLVIGSPGTGRSSAVKALNLSWPRGDAPIPMQVVDPLCTYWGPEKAFFIEPGPTVLGPEREENLLYELCQELQERRPREAIDGLLLVVSVQELSSLDEDGVQVYASAQRRALIQVAQSLKADVPVYVVVTALDTLWGFGDVFRWTVERRDEEPWGFSLPPNLETKDLGPRVKQELEGLRARLEAMCFAHLSTEAPADERTRAFQHLIELQDTLDKLMIVMEVVSMANSFERSPWVRALALGSALPGTGQRLHHGIERFVSMGLSAPLRSETPTPGGMPLHALLETVIMPERDIVPTHPRWRDDRMLLLIFMTAAVSWLGIFIVIASRWQR